VAIRAGGSQDPAVAAVSAALKDASDLTAP
jgi:hypothetical protein